MIVICFDQGEDHEACTCSILRQIARFWQRFRVIIRDMVTQSSELTFDSMKLRILR